MNLKQKLLALSLTAAAPAVLAQQANDMPTSPVVATADMLQSQSTETGEDTNEQLDEYGRPVRSELSPSDNNGPAASSMPTAPASVMSENVPSAKPLAVGQKVHNVEKISEKKEAPQYQTKPVEVVTSFGQTELVNVALGHPTRIVTPFMQPNVLKIDQDAIVSVKQNVIYFASDAKTPVTLHIREEGYEAQSISLTLLPQKIPPREIIVKIPRQEMADAIAFAGRNKKAEKWEKSEPYEKTLVNLMTTLAKGDVPSGYRVRDFRPSDEAPLCQQRGLRFEFSNGQVITGNDFTVYIGTAVNAAQQPIEFVETNCASREVASVSAWPEVYLLPTQKTEIFVVDKDQGPDSRLQRRRSLIGGAQ
ncbi:TraK domain-containing protein [Marinobacter sp. F3R08]|uniref:TraK domain-containing protein n=1 Tax=Marinobacter sp. F3R08 TaxID=2841559 RepID=UPI001C09612E|nr:type-F conjugative transfer system secretin TraK [Marinobacter sp. F3R08]MBU2952236.1 type-F conjugative transfer system secretin TraK [Marinobacter sp. F3R08]